MNHGFFTVISPAEFRELLQGFAPLPAQTAPLADCLGRCLAEDLAAPEDLPPTDRSCMDGYALRAADTFGASETNPAYLDVRTSLAIDQVPDFTLAQGQAAAIPTGGMLPRGADAVVMIEHTEDLGGGAIEVRGSMAPGQNVMLRGEDVALGQAALAAGTRLRPQEVGLLSALGVTEALVGRRPRAGILSTGDELVPVTATPRPGQIRDVNSLALSGLAAQAGAEAVPLGLVPDDIDSLTDALGDAVARCDCVFVSGGSSVGVRDLTVEALSRIGAEVLAHGVALSPGKPTILADAGGVPVFGLPGQVTSAQVVMLVFGMPLLARLAGDAAAFDETRRPARRAELVANLASNKGREDYVRVRLEPRQGQLPLARPVTGKSGLLRTMLLAHGLVRIDARSEGLDKGTEIDVWLM